MGAIGKTNMYYNYSNLSYTKEISPYFDFTARLVAAKAVGKRLLEA
jgi:hypothetical protein